MQLAMQLTSLSVKLPTADQQSVKQHLQQSHHSQDGRSLPIGVRTCFPYFVLELHEHWQRQMLQCSTGLHLMACICSHLAKLILANS